MSLINRGEYKTGEYARLLIEWEQGRVKSWKHSGLPDLWVFVEKNHVSAG